MSLGLRRPASLGLTFIAVLAALGIGSRALDKRAVVEAAGVQAPS
jgi:hypothetical protein